MFKKIMIPVDPTDIESAAYSLEIAKTLLTEGGKITVLSVIEDLPSYVVSQVPEDFEHKIRLNAHKEIEEFLHKKGVDAHLMLRNGHTSGAIIQEQKKGNYDLIVIASHKPHNLDYLLGTTATSVVRKAQCPVFVTR